jgi:hypothetical protein
MQSPSFSNMEKKNIHRNLLVALALVSFIAFITVNIHANRLEVSNDTDNTEQFVQPKIKNETDKSIELPGASVVSSAISIIQRLLSLSR